MPNVLQSWRYLLIAGVPVQIDGWFDGPECPANLRPFSSPETVRPGEGISFHLESGLPPELSAAPLTWYGSTGVLADEEKFWLQTRCGGVAAADSRLSTWRCWNGVKPLPENYSIGNRWLKLALWGYLTLRNGAYLHGSICVMDGRYLLFLGDSGVGKSTLSRLILAAGGSCLTDENPMVTLDGDDRPIAHGIPVPGVKGPPVPLSGPLAAMVFIRHAPDNDLRQISTHDAGRRLLRNARFFHWLPQTRPDTMQVLDAIARNVPAYDFGFVPEQSAVAVIRETLLKC